MSDYTPSTDEVRESHEFTVQQVTGCASGQGLAEFDRWFAGVLADAWDEGAEHGATAGCRWRATDGERCPEMADIRRWRSRAREALSAWREVESLTTELLNELEKVRGAK